MRKIALLLAIISVAVLAAPALSATNPFMDVPMNHWAYDAIGQLAAHGILSGYPDGTYKGKQATTRYEMASALARALAVVDMTKASKQDVEMLKRLVVEFKDELEALGVKVAELDERVAVLEDRLGGWHIHGTLVFDIVNNSANEAPFQDTRFKFDEARLFFERTWGENDEYFFRARLRSEGNDDHGDVENDARMDRFYVEMPFYGDTRLTVGRFAENWESDYLIDGWSGLPALGTWKGGSLMTDFRTAGFMLTKNFGIGTVKAVLAHPDRISKHMVNPNTFQAFRGGDYMFMINAALQFNEKFGLDLGGQVFVGDNSDTNINNWLGSYGLGDQTFKSMWTIFAGLRFNFTDYAAFKAIYYGQKWKVDEVMRDNLGNLYWGRANTDDPKHWAVMFDVKQEALKFTSLWLEYGQYDAGFLDIDQDGGHIFFSGSPILSGYGLGQLVADTKYLRVVLGQEWNDKWATHIFYYGYKIKDMAIGGGDAKPREIGVGVRYKLNDYTTMGLNYVNVDNDQPNADKDNVIRFRTSVSF